MTIILIYVGFFLVTTLSSLQRRFVIKRKDSEGLDQIRFAFEVMCILVIGSIVMQFFSPLYFSGSKLYLVFLSLICGVFGMGFFALNFMAQKHIDAGVSNVILNICTPLTIIFSSVFLRESLTNIQILGTALLLTSIILISQKHRISRFNFDKYFWMILLSGVFLSILLVAERTLQIQTGLTGATILSWGSQCFFLGLLTLALKSKHTYTNSEVLTTGILQLFSSIAYVVLLFYIGNLSLVSAVTTFKIVTVFIAAAIFLGEREDMPRKIFGSILAVIGLLLIK